MLENNSRLRPSTDLGAEAALREGDSRGLATPVRRGPAGGIAPRNTGLHTGLRGPAGGIAPAHAHLI